MLSLETDFVTRSYDIYQLHFPIFRGWVYQIHKNIKGRWRCISPLHPIARFLIGVLGQDANGHIRCLVARLWCNISKYNAPYQSGSIVDISPVDSRFSHHFGQASSRLGRDQSILETPTTQSHWALNLATSVCLDLPREYLSRFTRIYVDNEIDVGDFREMVSDSLEDWKSSLTWSLPLLL